MTALKVHGEPIYKPATRLRVRPATEEEWTIYDQEAKTAEPGEEILFLYLVDLDPYKEKPPLRRTATALRKSRGTLLRGNPRLIGR